MSVKMATKKHSFQDKWDEFENNGIKALVTYLTDEIGKEDKIGEVINQRVFDNKSFMRLYKIIYDLCIVPKGNFSKILYVKYVDVTTRYLQDQVLSDLTETSGVILLKRLANHWDKHMNIFVKWLGK